ncbi:GntR family transcriptional regulator [[Clostridium] fimetarium]|uniref:GntR family transcriptional regulator n=1 Tax=[Clostridium] fimetarium TaxID=99656 RepID=A0A1I0R0S2_9FIRM|nr:GntR family transcriptional regulator [[Clostridium] fimetarium]SEW33708.1 GntR family transcriptional regulator [[Clostridium] fimetarium]
MIAIDLMSRVPIYEQIIEQLETFVLKGILKVGDQIPSVRNLSIQLSINPNTIQKAYSELDRTGIIDTVPGRGSFIAKEAKENLRNLQGDQLDELSNIVKKLALAGITKEEIVESINKVFLEKVGKGKEND